MRFPHPVSARANNRLVWTRRFGLLLGAGCMAYPFLHNAFVLDLRVYLAGGRAVLGGRDVYAAGVAVHGYGFTYPPFAALLFAGLAALPLWAAEAVSVGAFYVALVLLISRSAKGCAAPATAGTARRSLR